MARGSRIFDQHQREAPPAPLRRSRATAVAGLAVGAVAIALLAAGGGHSVGPAHARATLAVLSPSLPLALGAERGTREGRAIDRVLSYTPYIAVGSARHRDVALTFDDGPGPFTRAIVRELKREHAKATFFVVGRWVSVYPALVRLEHREGFVVGDHTEDHAYLALLRPFEQHAEILDAARALVAAGAPYPRLFRPPYGSFDAATLKLLKRDRMLMTLWTVDTRDYARPGVKAIVRAAATGVRSGAILLLHDGGGDRSQTLAALPKIIRLMRHDHMHLVTVPQLILDDPPPRNQPQPHSLSQG